MNWGMGQVVAVVFVFMPALVWIQVMFGPDPIVTTAHDGNRSPEPNSLRLVVIDTISNSIPAVTLTATGTDNTLGGTTLNGTWRSQTSSNDSGILNRKYSMDEFYQSQQYRRRSKVVVYLTLLGATILITGQILSRLGQTVRSDEWTFSRLAYPNSGWETAKYVESKLDQKALTRNMLITMIASFLQLAFVSVIVLNRIWFTVGCILQVVDDFRALRSRCIHRQDGAVEERKSESACGIA
ncbi:hypothetical protein BJ508DRAFT_58594 [Ascobolus immersus RN42]|uniref:Uncharacterized protein n=1 Tax=Ascobolus immersus RN42 TaxID=1160509 RepID=A0A3N4HM30_ASCIM|nr:hypothetical protein BJ508DRAFT_58594 [Ascobolus immersus RN42]